MSFQGFANPQYFFTKISGIGPWMCRIDWCEGHWCGSTYMVVRLSDISSKTGKKYIFAVFRLFLRLRRTASQPYRLNHVDALRINQSYTSKDQSQKFSRKNIENWRFLKTQFFWVGHFDFDFFDFLLFPNENQSTFIGFFEGFFEILMITLVSSPKEHLPKDMQHSVPTKSSWVRRGWKKKR